MDNLFQTSVVSKWYANKSVLVTGGTGFMGKVLVEKILRSCPNVNKIYLLIRYKNNVAPEERMKKLLDAPLFDVLKKLDPNFSSKIKLMQGDVSKENLGLSEEDRDELAQNVAIVFHVAATVKFDEPLKYAVEMNIIGTESVIELCYEMKKLEAFVYLSTAFSNCNLKEIEEKVYDPPYDLEKLKMCIESLDSEMLEQLKQRLIRGRPNIYAFTKAMAESIVNRHSTNLPVAIVRPSVVGCTWNDPFPGWVDNRNGPAGIILGIGKGVIRTLIGRDEAIADVIPVDISINLMICTAWYIAKNNLKSTFVVNGVYTGLNPLTWGDVIHQAETNFCNYPQNGVAWYPNVKFRTNLFEFRLVKHFIVEKPSKLIDLFCYLSGRPMYARRMESQLTAAIYAMGFFTSNQWFFEKKNSGILFKSLTPEDQKLFNLDYSNINWKQYNEQYAIGTKRFVLKEELETLPTARKRLRMLKLTYYSLLLMLLLLFFFLFFFCFDLMKCAVSYSYKGIVAVFSMFYFYLYL